MAMTLTLSERVQQLLNLVEAGMLDGVEDPTHLDLNSGDREVVVALLRDVRAALDDRRRAAASNRESRLVRYRCAVLAACGGPRLRLDPRDANVDGLNERLDAAVLKQRAAWAEAQARAMLDAEREH